MDDPGFAVPSRLARLRSPLVTATVAGGLTLALRLRDPHTSGSWGLCPWLLLTGHFCPGCGSLRAVNDLTHGDLLGAASSNLLFLLFLPVAVGWWLGWAKGAWTGSGRARRIQHPQAWIAVSAAAMVGFAVLRNLPAGAWLAP